MYAGPVVKKSKLKKKVAALSPEEREELGHLLLESVLERMSEEEDASESEPAVVGSFDLILDEESDPESE